ncbi:MAG: hypothetical protein M1827_001219 [Pycnora praestabilis]|nr:MAG: hypothetical protein M1827_001219 [Pycnora praestabilis]
MNSHKLQGPFNPSLSPIGLNQNQTLLDPLEWLRGKGHKDFSSSEIIPLQQGRFLGRGVSGDVYEVWAEEGVPYARKQIYCSRRIKLQDVQHEVEVMKKLDHKHIIEFVGSFTQGRVLGMLLKPAAQCDLSTFLEELGDFPFDPQSSLELWKSLDLSVTEVDINGRPQEPLTLLRQIHGCIANAVEYLHKNDIRHKDLKPRNILLALHRERPTSDPKTHFQRVYITDFGISKDFADLSQSVTDGLERGTPIYRAPECEQYAPRGRPADIYSLGCVFVEMSTVLFGETLRDAEAFRTVEGNKSFQANQESVFRWLHSLLPTSKKMGWKEHTHDLMLKMLSRDPSARPDASQVVRSLYTSGGGMSLMHGICCESNAEFNKPDEKPAPLQSEEFSDLEERQKTLSTKYTLVKRQYFEKVDEVRRLQSELAAERHLRSRTR